MNLLADRTEPSDLTFWDRAYLQGLYHTDGQANRSMQASAMSDHIRQEIAARKVLPLSATQAPPTP